MSSAASLRNSLTLAEGRCRLFEGGGPMPPTLVRGRTEVLLDGRTALVSAPDRLGGRASDERLGGRRSSADAGRSRMLLLVMECLDPVVEAGRGIDGIVGMALLYDRRLTKLSLREGLASEAEDSSAVLYCCEAEVMLLLGRLPVRRTVIDEGILSACRGERVMFRGEPRGVVSLGAGNLDLAEWTRSSILAIRLRRPLICNRDSDLGSGSCVMLGRVTGRDLNVGGCMDFASDVAPLLLEAFEGPRACRGAAAVLGPYTDGRGVADCGFGLLLACEGVLGSALLCVGVSDSGGEGGVGASDIVSDLGGGVDAVGELEVTPLASLPGLLVRRVSTASGLGKVLHLARRGSEELISSDEMRRQVEAGCITVGVSVDTIQLLSTTRHVSHGCEAAKDSLLEESRLCRGGSFAFSFKTMRAIFSFCSPR
nr:hypothetical protein CFP56_36254 [Quercus suber]